ncbi:unnamed protein product [Blepharisma stoltei]|uniref:Cyclin-dependent kinase inhibitor domain-containing protein n=1 Tax=Blepharisma stoltei TaxID=1481888 RepID=A0AAU9K7F9_9CILI|nr:unnamed protein product [Blepharisma stoltei]
MELLNYRESNSDYLNEFLAQMKAELSAIVEEKSFLYDFDFQEDKPVKNPKRYAWSVLQKSQGNFEAGSEFFNIILPRTEQVFL